MLMVDVYKRQIFDYPPEKELEVRERIEYMKHKNSKGTDGLDRKSTRLNSSHLKLSRMPSSA